MPGSTQRRREVLEDPTPSKRKRRRVAIGSWLERRDRIPDDPRVTMSTAHTSAPTGSVSHRTARSSVIGGEELLRKEVIQPHLPVRLPCYDFTPITDPTFDGSLPKGLGHRLRVLPTFVV